MILNQNKNLIKNLIYKMEYFQDKELLVKYQNVKVNKIIDFMQLNKFKEMKDQQIIMKYKLHKILKIIKIFKYQIFIQLD